MPDSKHALFLASVRIHQWKKTQNITVNKVPFKKEQILFAQGDSSESH